MKVLTIRPRPSPWFVRIRCCVIESENLVIFYHYDIIGERPADLSIERQLSDAHASASLTREPAHHSHLTQSTSMSEEEGVAGSSSATAGSSNTTQPTVVSDTSKDD